MAIVAVTIYPTHTSNFPVGATDCTMQCTVQIHGCVAVLCGGCQSKTSVRRPYMPPAPQYPYMRAGSDMSPILHPCISMPWITPKNKGPSDGSARTISPTCSVATFSTGSHTVVSPALTMGYRRLLGYPILHQPPCLQPLLSICNVPAPYILIK